MCSTKLGYSGGEKYVDTIKLHRSAFRSALRRVAFGDELADSATNSL